MSRHEIPAKQLGDTAFVGWDPPLQTFFGQVYRAGLDEDENPFVWVGAAWPPISDVAELARVLELYADLSAEIQATLNSDKDLGR